MIILSAVVSALLAAAFVAWIARLLIRRWPESLVHGIRSRESRADARTPGFSGPILAEIRQALHALEERQRLELDYRENWTPRALQQLVRDHLRSPLMIVVSNRQPYIHERGEDGKPRIQVPASGMVTALEPIVRACSGVWIAHGSGSADRQFVDLQDRVRVPPSDPSYVLRRVWLTPEEEEGYYFGFSNEGLWPLCHLAYVRPAFRESDWNAYRRVNEKFAAAGWKPIVLVKEQQSSAQVMELYRAADFCVVNSLHDGMNLVSKEFVAARDDEDGVLILSTFAGSSRELPEALLINPYDVIETARAIETALAMPRPERRERMRLMRRTVKENNVYRWAGRMLMDLAAIRQRQSLLRPRTAPPADSGAGRIRTAAG